jgi:hypothetical protein
MMLMMMNDIYDNKHNLAVKLWVTRSHLTTPRDCYSVTKHSPTSHLNQL